MQVPFGCADGFAEAFHGRPERFLDPAVRRAQSAWGFFEDAVEQRVVEELANDLASGRWDERFGARRTEPSFEGALRLVVSLPA